MENKAIERAKDVGYIEKEGIRPVDDMDFWKIIFKADLLKEFGTEYASDWNYYPQRYKTYISELGKTGDDFFAEFLEA